jgi:hypothetical protein
MKHSCFYWAGSKGLFFTEPKINDPDLVFYFFDKAITENNNVFNIVKNAFPETVLVGSSTSAPLLNDDIYPGSLTGIAIKFSSTSTHIKTSIIDCPDYQSSFDAGVNLVKSLPDEHLKHILVISDGMTVNGDQFAKGINSVLSKDILVSGGLASDNFEFRETLCGINAKPQSGKICAIGFYGENISISTGAQGGWKKFERSFNVTSAKGHTLETLDNKVALDIYEEYLGEDAKYLPASGLYFPLAINYEGSDDFYVRTINAVDKDKRLLKFTGEIPTNATAQFMKANFSDLSNGAYMSAIEAKSNNQNSENGVVLAISCIGRQLLLGQKVADELDQIEKVFPNIPIVGFYSNGEFSYRSNHGLVLHNQTMTLTYITEKNDE